MEPVTDRPNMLNQEWFTPEQLAERIKQDVRTLCNWRSQKRGPRYLKVGKQIFYPAAWVEEWLLTLTPSKPAATEIEVAQKPSSPKRRFGGYGLREKRKAC